MTPFHICKFAVVFTLGAILLSSNGLAQVEVSASEQAPEDNYVIGTADKGAGNIRWYHYNANASGRRDIGQTFYAQTDAMVNRLVLHIPRLNKAEAIGEDAGGAEFTIRFYECSEVSDLEQAAPISAQSGRLPEHFNPGDALIFTFENVSLKHNQAYAFVLTFDVPRRQQYINLERVGGVSSVDGKLLSYAVSEGGNNRDFLYSESAGDLNFQLSESNP